MKVTDTTQIIQLDMTKLFRLKVPEGKLRKEFIEKLRLMPEVLYAEENGTVAPLAVPSDTDYGSQWSLNNPVNPGADIHAEAAWDIFTGNPNNIIAIIDGGADINHEDLNAKIAEADTGFGWDGHGIHVAGIAAAESNNTQGISGVDWQARILAKRIDNLSDDADTYQAIIDAVNFSPNVRVLNHSWGTLFSNQAPGRYSTTIAQAFAYAYKANRVSVAAMGNHQITHNGTISYPAGFNNVIAVGSTNDEDIIATSSVQGANIDIAAPGVGILSTFTGGGYSFQSGTSMASPHVAGIASLLKGYRPNLANDDIENIIKISADKVGNDPYLNGFNNVMGHGRVNAAEALTLLQQNTLNQFTATGGTVASSTGNYSNVFYATSGLAPGTYIVKRHEVTKAVTFPSSFCDIVGAWGRGVGSIGYSVASPNYGEGFCEVIPGTQTSTGATLRTYVYQMYNVLGQSLGYYPTTPANVTFAYTVLGKTNTFAISGPDSFCDNAANYSVSNIPEAGTTINWTATGNTTFSGSTTGNTVTIVNNTLEQIVLTATIVTCGVTHTITKNILVGMPPVAAITGDQFATTGVLYGCFIQEYPEATAYEWFVTNGDATVYHDNTNWIDVMFEHDGYYIIQVKISTPCGDVWSEKLYVNVSEENQFRTITYSSFPNPVDSEITIQKIITRNKKRIKQIVQKNLALFC